MNSLQSNDFVTGLILDDRLYVMVKEGKSKLGVEIKAKAFEEHVCGADYFSYHVSVPSENDARKLTEVTEFFLLLPLLDKEGKRLKGKFYLITSGWREAIHQKDNQWSLQLPVVPGASY